MITIMLFVIPLVGMLLFLNLIAIIKRIKIDGFINNLLALGAFLSFAFVFLIMYTLLGLH